MQTAYLMRGLVHHTHRLHALNSVIALVMTRATLLSSICTPEAGEYHAEPGSVQPLRNVNLLCSVTRRAPWLAWREIHALYGDRILPVQCGSKNLLTL